MSQGTPEARSSLAQLPGGIWALGFVSLFMDISSEMIHGLLPVFLTSVLGASAEMIGLIEGVGEATASLSKLVSGWISDKVGRRKPLTVMGYGLAALSKPIFALAPTSSVVLAARFSDRVGKGIREAPRDAMAAEMAPPGLRGAAHGLRQALDTVGAFAGPLIAIALMATLHDNFRVIFWLALIPALIAVFVLCRVGGDVAIPTPHRPGRADFPHPVPHARASLMRRGAGGRSWQEAKGGARAWLRTATTASCCGGRVARATSSICAGPGGDTTGSAGCCP